jgi:hypothetical protein
VFPRYSWSRSAARTDPSTRAHQRTGTGGLCSRHRRAARGTAGRVPAATSTHCFHDSRFSRAGCAAQPARHPSRGCSRPVPAGDQTSAEANSETFQTEVFLMKTAEGFFATCCAATSEQHVSPLQGFPPYVSFLGRRSSALGGIACPRLACFGPSAREQRSSIPIRLPETSSLNRLVEIWRDCICSAP